MATTTTNFGWDIPQSTDLVKDGATAIAALGQDIDTALVDLKGGTTGQVLAKASNTDLDFTWATDASGIPATIFDAKGDLIAASAADTAARLAVGTNGQVLTADSTAATGIKWATPAGGGKLLQVVGGTTTTQTTIATTTLTSTSLSATITPSATTSKILVLVTSQFKHQRSGNGFSGIAAELDRNGTVVGDWDKTDHDEFNFIQIAGSSAAVYSSNTVSVSVLDSPSSTSALTYTLKARGYDSSVSVNFQQNSALSTITLLEIGA